LSIWRIAGISSVGGQILDYHDSGFLAALPGTNQLAAAS
jgi:hypothetical protein